MVHVLLDVSLSQSADFLYKFPRGQVIQSRHGLQLDTPQLAREKKKPRIAMKKLILLSTTTGYQASAFREAARRMGVPLALASDRCHVLEDPWQDGAIAVRFQHPRESAHAIVEFARSEPIAGIVAVGDQPTLAGALAARELKIPFHPPGAAEACRDKFLMRGRFRAAGMKVPSYARFRALEDLDKALESAPFPCVLKPTGLSASRGVIRANDAEQFREAWERILSLLEAPDVRMATDDAEPVIQVESYIPGIEVAVEGVMIRGRLKVLATFDKPDPLEGPFFEETIYTTPSRLPAATQRAIIACTEQAVAALGLWHGPLHAEMRVNNSGCWMLEVAARPIGGLCAQVLRFDGGMSLEELLLRHALGKDVSRCERETQAAGVMMIPIAEAGVFESVEGLESARRVRGIESVEITAKPRLKLVPLPEGASYLGFIFARGGSPRFVESALREAHGKLRLVMSPAFSLV
jgi:biotin carboxylase